jgi:hypothetical protein
MSHTINRNLPPSSKRSYSRLCIHHEGTHLVILNFGTRWGSVINFMPQPLFPRGKSPGTDWTEPGWKFRKRYKFFAPIGMRTLDRPATSTTAIQEQQNRRGTTGRSNVDGKCWEVEYVKMRRILLDKSRCVCVWIRHNTDDRILRHDTRLETITDLCEIMRWCLLRPEIFNETWVGYHHLRRILLGAGNFNLQKVFKVNLKFNAILLAFY